MYYLPFLLVHFIAVLKSQNASLTVSQLFNFEPPVNFVDATPLNAIYSENINTTHSQIIQHFQGQIKTNYILPFQTIQVRTHFSNGFGTGYFLILVQSNWTVSLFEKETISVVFNGFSNVDQMEFGSTNTIFFCTHFNNTISSHNVLTSSWRFYDFPVEFVIKKFTIQNGYVLAYAIKAGSETIIIKFDEDLAIIEQFSLAYFQPVLNYCCQNIAYQNGFITLSVGVHIEVLNMGSIIFSTDRPDQVYNAVYTGQTLLVIEKEGMIAKLRSINITDGRTSPSQIELQTNVNLNFQLYKIKPYPELNTICLFNINNSTVLNFSFEIYSALQNSDQTNQIFNYINESNQVNQTAIQHQGEDPKKQQKTFSQVVNNIFSGNKKMFVIVQTSINVSFSFQISTALFRSFLNLIEDFWIYSYHQKTYPEFFQILIKDISFLHQIRVKPEFISSLNLQIDCLKAENKKYQLNLPTGYQKQSDQYFIYSIREVYTYEYLIVVASFGLLFTIRMLLYCSISSQSFEFLHNYFRSKSTIKNFMLALFAPNISIITFYGFIQLKAMYSYSFDNKLNLCCTVAALFCWILFTMQFYLYIYFASKKASQEIPEISKFCLQGLVIENVINNVRTLLQSGVHAILLNSHLYQLSGLCLLDFSIIVFCIGMREYFKKNVLFGFCLAYYVFFLLMDLTLLIYSGGYFPDLDYDLTLAIIVAAMSALVIFKTLFFVYEYLRNILKYLKKYLPNNNKIISSSKKTINRKNDRSKRIYVKKKEYSQKLQHNQKLMGLISQQSQIKLLKSIRMPKCGTKRIEDF